MDLLNYITWDVSPEIFHLGKLSVRWYGLLFAGGLLIGQLIIQRIFKAEGKPAADVDRLTIYMFLATVIGARLGHCLFYETEYYLKNPLEILQVWKGGLASHGAAIGILIALYFYTKKVKGQSYLWILDRIVIVTALAGGMIRLGNLMNSEIVGIQTSVPWGFIFVRNHENFARHPAQLYEAITCFILFMLLYAFWRKKKAQVPEGSFFGMFLIYVFGLRFFYEFIKQNQVPFEDALRLNVGQLLSIPLVLIGVGVLVYSLKKRSAGQGTGS